VAGESGRGEFTVWELSELPTLQTDDVTTRTRSELSEAALSYAIPYKSLWQGSVLQQPVCPSCFAFMHFAEITRNGSHKCSSSTHTGTADIFLHNLPRCLNTSRYFISHYYSAEYKGSLFYLTNLDCNFLSAASSR